MPEKKDKQKLVAENRKARHDYFLEERFEAGIALTGTEIKSVRAGKVQFKDAYISIYKGEAWIKGMGLVVDGYNVLKSQAQGMRTVNMEMTLCMNVTDDFPIPQR